MTETQGYTGGCYCGKNRWKVTSPAQCITLCHCTTCRHLSGSSFLPFIRVVNADFSWTTESDTLKQHELSPGNIRTFCSACGTPLTMSYRLAPHAMSIAVGSVDDEFEKALVEPLVIRTQRNQPENIFVSQQPQWADLHTWEHDVRKFERFAPGDPVAAEEQYKD